jgi:hypothetical protein
MSTIETQYRDIEVIKAGVLDRCVTPIFEYSPIMDRGLVISALGQLAAVETAHQTISSDELEELHRRYIGAYCFDDAKSQIDRQELLSWLGNDDRYLKSTPTDTHFKPVNERLFVHGEPIIGTEWRDVVSYSKAGIKVVGSLISIVPTDMNFPDSLPDLLADKLPVAELMYFEKVLS